MTQLAWGKKVSPEFRKKVYQIVEEFRWPKEYASYLMSCIAFETGRTFSPKVRNPSSSAIGLIQFMSSTLKGLGYTKSVVEKMTAEEQLDLVKKYFYSYAYRIKGLEDMYMAILWPVAVGKPNEYVLWKRGTLAYGVNKGLDSNKNGVITKKEAAQKVLNMLYEGLEPKNVYTETEGS